MLIFVVSVLYLFLVVVMFSSCVLMFTFPFQELLISSRLELSRFCMFILFREFACCTELCVLIESRSLKLLFFCSSNLQ